jgi:hypothetical protein
MAPSQPELAHSEFKKVVMVGFERAKKEQVMGKKMMMNGKF